jgi:hypothetical protein
MSNYIENSNTLSDLCLKVLVENSQRKWLRSMSIEKCSIQQTWNYICLSITTACQVVNEVTGKSVDIAKILEDLNKCDIQICMACGFLGDIKWMHQTSILIYKREKNMVGGDKFPRFICNSCYTKPLKFLCSFPIVDH